MGETHMRTHIIIPLLVIGSILTATIGIAHPIADSNQNTQTTTIDFVDCTGHTRVVRTIQMPTSQWRALQHDLSKIRSSGPLTQESFTAQIHALQHYGLISNDAATTLYPHHATRTRTVLPAINNSNINAMCAISVTLQSITPNGSTVVLGLNSFINYIGFDIVSFHYGNATDGIQTTGLVKKTSPPGEYSGFMFGFLGYWVGEKIKTGVYKDLTAVGFTVITAWIPVL